MRLPSQFLASAMLAAAMSTAIAEPVLAQALCGPREAIVAPLETHAGERQAARGLIDEGHVMELWANPATGSWTLMVMLPGGLACVTALGDSFEAGPAPAAEETPPGDGS